MIDNTLRNSRSGVNEVDTAADNTANADNAADAPTLNKAKYATHCVKLGILL